MQVIVGIGAKPAVSPFEAVGVNNEVGGIEVCFHPELMNLLWFTLYLQCNMC
jgi:hypothetical protein